MVNGRLKPNIRLRVTNPATGEVITTLALSDEKDAQDVIVAANNAFQQWKDTSVKTRFELLKKWFDLILQISKILPL